MNINFVKRLLSGSGARDKYFRVLTDDGFKFIEPGSYLIKSNRFGEIVRQDFLSGEIKSAQVTQGVMRYNAEESVIFGDWQLCFQTAGDKKEKNISCLALLHLHKNPMPLRVKLRLDKPDGKLSVFMADLSARIVSAAAEGFVLSGDSPGGIERLCGDWTSLIAGIRGKFPFVKAGSRGLLVVCDKGWLIISAPTGDKGALDSIVGADRVVFDCLSKKNV